MVYTLKALCLRVCVATPRDRRACLRADIGQKSHPQTCAAHILQNSNVFSMRGKVASL